MGTALSELKRKCFLRNKDTSGQWEMAVVEGINIAHKVIARKVEVPDLLEVDTTHALTVASTASYHLTTDWGLTRPKDILTLRYIDGGNSRKLSWIPPEILDARVPLTSQIGEGVPSHYTRRGMYVELFKIPSEAMPIYVYYSQWPVVLSAEADESSLDDSWDDIVVMLAVEAAGAIVRNELGVEWYQRAREMLLQAVGDEVYRPDEIQVGEGFNSGSMSTGEYWKDPFVKRSP